MMLLLCKIYLRATDKTLPICYIIEVKKKSETSKSSLHDNYNFACEKDKYT